MPSGYKNGKPDISYWMKEIRSGIQFRKRHASETQWKTWRNYYRGNWSAGVLPTNIFFKMIRTMVPRIYFRNPGVSITPNKSGDGYALLSLILERVDNKLLDVLHVKQTMKKMILDAALFGTGIGKVGYGAQFTPTPDILETVAPGRKRHPQFRTEYNSLVLPNMPWFMRVPTGKFIVPNHTQEFSEARWVAHWTYRSIKDLQEDPRFSNTANLQPGRIVGDSTLGLSSGTQTNMVDLVEVTDKMSGQVFVMAPYASDKILFCEDSEFLEVMGRPNYYPLIFNDDDEVFWGIPDAKILDPQQREANEIRTMIMRHRRISIRKILAKSGTLSPDEAGKLTDENTDAVVKIDKNASMNDIKIQEMGDIPAGLLKSDNIVLKDVQEILGLGTNQWGDYAPGSADRSATEAQIVNQATQIRIDERRDTVADLLTEVVSGMNHVIFNKWDGEQVVKFVGNMGVEVWVALTPEMLQPQHYAINVDPDSNLPKTSSLRRQEAIQSFQLLAPNQLIDPVKLTKWLLHELHGVQYDDLMKQGPQTQAVPGQNVPPAQGPGASPNNPMAFAQLLQGATKGNVTPMRKR